MSDDTTSSTRRWEPGALVDYRFVRPDGSTSGVHPMTVVCDDGVKLLGWVPVGTAIRSSVLLDGQEIRSAELDQRFRLPRRLIDSTWTGTSTLRLVDDERWSSVWWFFEGDTGTFRGWYVNLEIPLGRNESGVMRSDGVLDVWVDPDGTWRWKDEDEFVAALDAGRFTVEQAALLRAEGERMGALADLRDFPFDGTHTGFRP